MSRFSNTISLYDRYAREFADKLEQLPETRQLDEFVSMLSAQSKVLDLGSGSGRDAEYLSKAGLNVIGVDISSGLVGEAKKRHPGIEFKVMDILKLDFPESSFNGIWSKLTILHIDREDLPNLLRTLFTILSSNGTLMVETKAGVGEALEKVSFNDAEERLFVYYELDELISLFEKAGFVEVSGYYYSADGKHATHVKDRVVVHGKKKVSVSDHERRKG